MPMKVLLAILDHRASNAGLLATACGLASHWVSRLDAALLYPHAWERNLEAISDESSRYRVQRIEEELLAARRAVVQLRRREFEDACARHAIPEAADASAPPPCVRWHALARYNRECRVIAHARLSDLVLMQRPHAETSQAYRALTTTMLRESGRLLLVAPPRPVATRCARIAIAWNGGLEASRAVATAVNLLAAAEQVDILTAESERTGAATAKGLARYLAGRGVAAREHVLPKARNRAVADAILAECAELGSDLLVMGGHIRNPLDAIVFGGMTRDILERAEMPVALAQ